MAIKNSKVSVPPHPPGGFTDEEKNIWANCITRSETLIVWTESNGTDMALSFQEAEGCAVIW
jgi:hypothetical protein